MRRKADSLTWKSDSFRCSRRAAFCAGTSRGATEKRMELALKLSFACCNEDPQIDLPMYRTFCTMSSPIALFGPV